MKVYTNWRPGTDVIDVWLYRDDFSGKRLLTRLMGPDTFEDIEIKEGDHPEPSFSLPGDMFQALVAAGSDILPPSASTERHLQDAIKVRDRLLDKVVPPR